MLANFILEGGDGDTFIILADELDKLGFGGDLPDSSYNRHTRTKIHQLLDLNVPVGLEGFGQSRRHRAETILRERTLIIGAGAFQHLWETVPQHEMGFASAGSRRASPTLAPDPNMLSRSLPRELVNRFRSSLVVLPQLATADYREMVEYASQGIPAYLRRTFLELGLAGIDRAMDSRQGARYVEELLLDTIMAERAAISLSKKADDLGSSELEIPSP